MRYAIRTELLISTLTTLAVLGLLSLLVFAPAAMRPGSNGTTTRAA